MIGAPELSALIHLRGGSAATDALNSLKALKAGDARRTGESTGTTLQGTSKDEQTEAQSAARQFESLLIHNMLKSMRKTTMSENKSNQRAIYDDMLDQRLAEGMVKAGGLGIADQLVKKLSPNTHKTEKPADIASPQTHLRKLAAGIRSTPAQPASTQTINNSAVSRLRMVSELWGESRYREQAMHQQTFLQPLYSHAQLAAQRLGTSANAILAVAALETGWGKHMMKNPEGVSTNNYFGIKANENDKNHTQNTTTEYVNGTPLKLEARFVSYRSPADSIQGFANFIIDNPRYSNALKKAQDPEQFLREIHKAGYATDPQYAEKAISVLHQINSHPLPL